MVGLEQSAAFGANLAAVTVLALGAIVGGDLVDRYPARFIGRTDNPLVPAWYLAATALVSFATAATGLRHDRPVPMAAATPPW